jgi:hypothetical protein
LNLAVKNVDRAGSLPLDNDADLGPPIDDRGRGRADGETARSGRHPGREAAELQQPTLGAGKLETHLSLASVEDHSRAGLETDLGHTRLEPQELLSHQIGSLTLGSRTVRPLGVH